MLLVIECMITCIIFAVIVLSTQYKDPVKYIMSYPPEIRKRVESLPEYKNSIKKEKGINSQLAFLKQQIEKERDELEGLKQDKSKTNESTEFRTVKVDDLQQLKILREYLNLYFDLGYNGQKYYQYYQRGQLDRKLQKYYSDTGIQKAKDYLEEKGPSLVLKKKNSNNRNNS